MFATGDEFGPFIILDYQLGQHRLIRRTARKTRLSCSQVGSPSDSDFNRTLFKMLTPD